MSGSGMTAHVLAAIVAAMSVSSCSVEADDPVRRRPGAGATRADETLDPIALGVIAGALDAPRDDVREVVSQRAGTAVFALVEVRAGTDVKRAAAALEAEDGSFDLVEVFAEDPFGTSLFEDLPEPGSGAFNLSPMKAGGHTVGVGYVDPTFTSVEAWKNGALLKAATPDQAGAIILPVEMWAQVRVIRGERLVGASLLAGRLRRPAGVLDGDARRRGVEFVREALAGTRELEPWLAREIPAYVADDLGAALIAANVDKDGVSTRVNRRVLKVAFGTDASASKLDLYMTRQGHRWRIYLYSFGSSRFRLG